MKINEQTLRKIIRNALTEIICEADDCTWTDFARPEDYKHTHAQMVSKSTGQDGDNSSKLYNYKDLDTNEIIFPIWFSWHQFIGNSRFVALGEDGIKYIMDWPTGKYTIAKKKNYFYEN